LQGVAGGLVEFQQPLSDTETLTSLGALPGAHTSPNDVAVLMDNAQNALAVVEKKEKVERALFGPTVLKRRLLLHLGETVQRVLPSMDIDFLKRDARALQAALKLPVHQPEKDPLKCRLGLTLPAETRPFSWNYSKRSALRQGFHLVP